MDRVITLLLGIAVGGLVGWSLADFLPKDQNHTTALETENQQLKQQVDQLRQMIVGGLYAELESLDPEELPFDASADAELEVAEAMSRSKDTGKILMVTFGANWCADCRNLYKALRDEEVAAYLDKTFVMVNVDIGEFDRNLELASSLDVSLNMGVPVAAFFDPAGETIGNTNEGQLDRARFFTSKQILRFIRDVAERGRIAAPDAL
ncbi:MAG: thioredoxin family protein [Pseudomonadota bacterium]